MVAILKCAVCGQKLTHATPLLAPHLLALSTLLFVGSVRLRLIPHLTFASGSLGISPQSGQRHGSSWSKIASCMPCSLSSSILTVYAPRFPALSPVCKMFSDTTKGPHSLKPGTPILFAAPPFFLSILAVCHCYLLLMLALL